MSVQLTKTPFPLDFIKNEIGFDVLGNPITSMGKKYVTVYVVDLLPVVGKKVLISFYNRTLEFTVKASGRGSANDGYAIQNVSGNALIAELKTKIENNYYLNLYYDVVVGSDSKITFTSKEFGGEQVVMQSEDDADFFTLDSKIVGYTRNELDHYRIYGKYIIDRYYNEINERIESPEMYLSLNSKYKAFIPVDFLKCYFENVDIPQISISAFTKEILKYAFLKVKLQYAEFFYSKVQLVNDTDFFYLLNGSCLSSHRSVNKQEWLDPLSSDVISKSKRLRIFGSNQDTVRSFPDMLQFIYMYYFDVESAVSAERTAIVSVVITAKDGTTTTKQFTFKVKNYNFVRINCSVASLGITNLEDVMEYSVSIFDNADSTKSFGKTFRLFNKPIHSSTFLLQNRYGVLDGFYCESQKIEQTTTGEKLLKGSKIAYDIESEYKFTSTTGFKSENELQLLSDALENRFNFIVINNTAVPITLVPGSIVVRDKKEDLLSAEFEYRINSSTADQSVLLDYFKEIAYISGTLDPDTVVNEQDIVNINDRVNIL